MPCAARISPDLALRAPQPVLPLFLPPRPGPTRPGSARSLQFDAAMQCIYNLWGCSGGDCLVSQVSRNRSQYARLLLHVLSRDAPWGPPDH